MRVVMDFHRDGAQYVGTLVREQDRLPIPFWGVLELLAALERIEAESDSGPAEPPARRGADDA